MHRNYRQIKQNGEQKIITFSRNYEQNKQKHEQKMLSISYVRLQDNSPRDNSPADNSPKNLIFFF